MNTQLGTAAQAMSERLGLNLSVVDVGWQGASPMAWASSLSAIAIPIAILVNVVMLGCKLTRTVNIDIWNIWHIIFTGALAYTVTGKLWIGILGIVVHSIVVYKLGDLWAPFIEDYFELSGLTVPHGTAAYMAPVACLDTTPVGCERSETCVTLPLWKGLAEVIENYLDSVTLQDLLERQTEMYSNTYII